MNKSDITGIILSGGKSSRLGEEKGLAAFNGKPLVSYAVEVLEPLCGKLVISANNQLEEYSKFGYQIVQDEFKGVGPMGGILTCLKKSESRFNLVLSCDTPFVNTTLFEYLLQEAEHYQVVVPRHDGFIEPLCAIYSTNVLWEMQHCVESGNFKMHEFFKKVDLKAIDIPSGLPFYSEDLFVNINTQKELKGLQPND
jgi:molybdopterin-guanine dinucleotide biosynthesis protein A